MQVLMQRLPAVVLATGLSRSTLYGRVSTGLWPRAVRISTRLIGWPSSEVDALNAARIAGKTDDEIRALVQRLEAARPSSFATYTPDSNPKVAEGRAAFYAKVRAGEELAPRDRRRRAVRNAESAGGE